MLLSTALSALAWRKTFGSPKDVRMEKQLVVKNGKIYNGKQNFRCRDCAREFVQDSQNKMIEQATQDLINKLLLEQIPLAGIARVTDVSEPWLQSYVNAKYQAVSKQVDVQAQKRGT